ncbi:MAG: hypothetical protein EBW87_00860 [Burkholderiaceae bacterium]|jgi:hypothetical protein|nr:hypothetical protein [Burkholderiaceae bacterium]
MSQLIDPRPLEPPDDFVDEACHLVVSSSLGIYVPQYFTENNERTKDVSEWAWDTCKLGPEQEFYWEAWELILSNYEFFEHGPDDLTYRYSLQHHEDLFLICEPYLESDYDA